MIKQREEVPGERDRGQSLKERKNPLGLFVSIPYLVQEFLTGHLITHDGLQFYPTPHTIF